MKKLSLLVLLAFLSASCSSLDKFKTPEDSNAGLKEGEKSNYLLNRPDDAKNTAPVAKPAAKKKASAKKKTK